MKICVNTQTPLVRFNLSVEEFNKKYGGLPLPINLKLLSEDKDFVFSPGGVTRMVYPLLRELVNKEGEVHWVSLNPSFPLEAKIDKIVLHPITLPNEKLKGYGLFKESLWKAFHGLSEGNLIDLLWQREYSDYTYYNRLSSEKMLNLDKIYNFDFFYIHDFQQLPVGHMLHTVKRKIFRWHIPFDESSIPEEWKDFLSLYLNSYDAVIVSCKGYLKTLDLLGYNGKAYYIYPYLDPSHYNEPNELEVKLFKERFGIDDKDRVILVVARLDPMKGQDRVIKALRKVSKDFPNLKLLLVGNGSFSSSKQGIGLSKAEIWLSYLKDLAKDLKVIFTGYLSQRELNVAYYISEFTILPSIKEGFGLVVIESWLFKKPVIVSKRAGIAEIINEGENGFLFDPEDLDTLVDKMKDLLSNPEKVKRMGEKGFQTSKRCLIEEGIKEEVRLIESLI